MEIAVMCLQYLRLILQSRRGLEKDGMQDTQSFVNELSDRPLLDYTLAFLLKHINHLKHHGIPGIISNELSRLIEAFQQSP